MADQLRAEAKKHRNKPCHSILTKQPRTAAFRLKNNLNIVIRKTDKDSKYVILNKSDYFNKCNEILHDTSKFIRVKKDINNNIKKKANELIETLNAKSDDFKMNKIVGDYHPGYFYGNIKSHKIDNPIRPIVSQVTTTPYNMAKTLSKIINRIVQEIFLLIQQTNLLIL